MSIGKYEIWVNPGLHAKQIFVWADSLESATAAVGGEVFSCALHMVGHIWAVNEDGIPHRAMLPRELAYRLNEQARELRESEARRQREDRERRNRQLQSQRRRMREAREPEKSQPKPHNLPPSGQNDHYETGIGHVLSRPYRKVRIVEQPEVSLPVPLTDMPDSAVTSSPVLKDEIDNRANAMLQWAPWARRNRRSRRYEGFR